MSTCSGALAGKVAVVFGGTSGIGRATALALAELGADVVIGARDDDVHDVVGDIRALGSSAEYVPVDVAVAAQVEALCAHAAAKLGTPTVAVNAAASTAAVGKPVAELDESEVDEQLAVTLKGTWTCMRAELRWMVEGGGGSIVNVASTNALSGAPRFALYSAAKHGVLGLTRSAAREYAPHGIRINAVCPGATDTPMLARAFSAERPGCPDAARAARIQRIPTGRIATPEEVAGAIAWLSSPAASSVVGQALTVDGGDSA